MEAPALFAGIQGGTVARGVMTVAPPAQRVLTTAIIHDNLGVVLTYAFSKQALDEPLRPIF